MPVLTEQPIVAAWQSQGQDADGSYFGIFRRRLVFSGLESETMIGKNGGDTFVFEAAFSSVDITEFDPSIDRIIVGGRESE